jgi:hypothetical protein
MVTIVYRGGADLFFRDGSGTKRRAAFGVPIDVDEKTAEILLRDPAVSLNALGAPAPPAAPPPASLEEMTMAQLQVAAAGLGLTVKARTPKPALLAAIRAAQSKVAVVEPVAIKSEPGSAGDEDNDEDEAPASDPTPRAGAIHLEDIPAAGRIQHG